MEYALHLGIYLCIYCMLAASLNLVVGYCGLLSLAHATFFAVGAYTYALCTLKLGLGFGLALVAAIGVAAILGLTLGIPAGRLRGDAFVLVSLAVQALGYSIILNWHDPSEPLGTLRNLTNGLFGISGIPRPAIFGIKFDTTGSIAVIGGLLAGGSVALVGLLGRSPWGRVLQCMRDDELALRTLGKSPRVLKLEVVCVSCGVAGAAGALYALYAGYVDPSLASLGQSVLLLSMLLIGGSGNLRGPLLGAALLLAFPELLRSIRVPDARAGEIRLLAYGLLLVIAMRVRPQGLAGRYRVE